MPSRAQNRAVQLNANRRRTPRILKSEWDNTGNNITIYFDRKMDQRAPANVNILVCDGVNNRQVEFAGNIIWVSAPERLSSDDMTSEQAYTGPSFVVIRDAGNLRALARFNLDNGERCDRMEIA